LSVAKLPQTIEEGYDSTSENATSKVYILPSGIEMASKNGIQIKSGAGIDIKSSDNINVSVISLDKDKGIWMGSTGAINLFSGNLGEMPEEINGKVTYEKGHLTEAGKTWVSENGKGAAVEISNERILFGVANFYKYNNLTKEDLKDAPDPAATATVVDLTKDHLVLGAGANVKYLAELSSTDVLLTGENVSGVVIKANSIGMAVGQKTDNEDARTLISIDKEGIILGKAADLQKEGVSNNSELEGSFIKLTNEGVFLGSKGQFYINTTNVYIDDSTVHKSDYIGADGETRTAWKGAAFGLGHNVKDWTKMGLAII